NAGAARCHVRPAYRLELSGAGPEAEQAFSGLGQRGCKSAHSLPAGSICWPANQGIAVRNSALCGRRAIRSLISITLKEQLVGPMRNGTAVALLFLASFG